MKKFLSIFAVLFLLISVHPTSAHAYFTTRQAAVTIDNDTAIFTIDFKFGHASHDIYIPIAALNTPKQSSSALSYQILNSEGEIAKGATTAIVLSTAQVKDGMYVIQKGTAKTFTFLVFFTPDTIKTESTARAQVTNLPFSFDGTKQLALNTSELTYYTTPTISLHKPLFVFPDSGTFTIQKSK